MKLSIMQPYFLPYIGYFQLAHYVDEFVVYDNIEYTKKGWINRNRILLNGRPAYFTLPLKNGSDYLRIDERWLADSWNMERIKILNRIKAGYLKAPYFEETYELIEECFFFEDTNLFRFIFNSLNVLFRTLEISCRLTISSDIEGPVAEKGESRVINICKLVNAETYVNPIGGIDLYSKKRFMHEGIDLTFLKTEGVEYKQLNSDFVPHLSIIDVLMFNSRPQTIKLLDKFLLV